MSRVIPVNNSTAASQMLSSGLPDTQSRPPGKDESNSSYVQTNSSKTSTSFSSITGKNAFNNLVGSVFEFVVTLRPKESLTCGDNNVRFFLVALCHLHFMYSSIIVSSTPTAFVRPNNILWGDVTSWIWRSLFFPINFACEFYSYEAIYALSCVFMVSQVALGALVYYCKWASKKGGKLFERVKDFVLNCLILQRFLSLFIIYIHALLLAPNMSDRTSYYFPHHSLSSVLQTVFMAIGAIGILTTIVLNVVGNYLTLETSARNDRRNWFSLASIHPFVFLAMTNQISVAATVICGDRYSYIASIIKIVLSALSAILLLKSLPFFRRWENHIMIGISFSKMITPIGPLVLNFITLTDRDMIGGIITGATIVLSVVGFMIGFLVSYIFIRLKLSSIRKLIADKTESSFTLKHIESSKNLQSNLSLFIRFSLSTGKKGEGSDYDLAKFCVNTYSKNINNSNILVMSALFVSFGELEEYDSSQAYSIGLALLQKAGKTSPSFLQVFEIMMRNEELEYNAFHDNSLEVMRKLSVAEKRIHALARAHKTFFKELLNDRPSVQKLETINSTCCAIYNDCDRIYESLLSVNRNNKTLLRSYAGYLEKYKWDFSGARAFYDEAQEDEDNRKAIKLSKLKGNAIISNKNQETDTGLRRFSTDSRMADDNWDSISAVMEAAENDEDRKDTIIRNAINTPMNTSLYIFWFIVFAFISVASVCIIAPMALSFSSGINSRMAMQEKVCLMTPIPFKLLTQIRALQSDYLRRGLVSEQLLNSTTKHTQDLLSLIMSVLSAGDNNQLMPEVAEEYLKIQYALSIPVANYTSSNTTILPSVTTTNTSLQFYLSSLYNQGNEILTMYQDAKALSSNLDANYAFLFLFYNRIPMTNAFNDFCNKFVNESVNTLNMNFQMLYITVICVISIYLLVAFSYMTVMYFHSRRTIKEINRVFKKIPLDEIGKIYHNFDKKTDDSMTSTTSSLLKFSRIIMVGTILLILVVCVCSGMVILEFNTNSTRTSQSMKNLGIINRVSLTISRSNFRLNELIWRIKHWTLSLAVVKVENLADIMNVKTYWNAITVGSADTNFQSVVVGKYSDVDQLLLNTCSNETTAYQQLDDPCYGLTVILSTFVTKALDLNGLFFTESKNKYQMVEDYFQKLFFLSQSATSMLRMLVSLLVAHEKIADISTTCSVMAICIVCTLIYAVICYSSLRSFWKERHCLRLLLNYVSVELIENNLVLKDFVITNSSSTNNFGTKALSKFETNSAQEKLKDELEMVKSVLNGGVDASLICDKEGLITVFNSAAEEMFGYQRSQVLGIPIQKLFTEEYSTRSTKILTTGETHDTFEACGLRKNKTTFSSKVSVSNVIHDRKQILVVFIRDITPEKKQNILIAEEKKKSEDLLLNILPVSMASKLKNGDDSLYEKISDITVFFSDMVGFTAWSSKLQASELVKILNTIVNGFDHLTEIHAIDKIKTIGDAYFCVSGLHASKSSDHPERMVRFSIEIMSLLKTINQNSNTTINLRIGLHTGEAVGGVIGFKKFAYDLWGDTINTASRMESTSQPGRIQLSRSTYGRVYDLFEFEEQMIEVKGKGLCQTYLLKDKHHENPLSTVLGGGTNISMDSIGSGLAFLALKTIQQQVDPEEGDLNIDSTRQDERQ